MNAKERKRLAEEGRKHAATSHLEKTNSMFSQMFGGGVQYTAPMQYTAPLKTAPVQDTAPPIELSTNRGVQDPGGVQDFRVPDPDRVQDIAPVQDPDRVQDIEGVQDIAPMQDTAPPVENIDALKRMAELRNFAAFGMLMLLREVTSTKGGTISLKLLSRLTGMSINAIRGHIKTLEKSGIISVTDTGPSGSTFIFNKGMQYPEGVQYTEGVQDPTPVQYPEGVQDPDLPPRSCSIFNTLKTTTEGLVNKIGFKTTVKIHLEEFFAAISATGKDAQNLPDQLAVFFVTQAMKRGKKFAVATILEFLPKAKTNPTAYIQAILDKGGTPKESYLTQSDLVLKASEKIRLPIGKEILPRDWSIAARTLKISSRVESEIAKEKYLQKEKFFIAKAMGESLE